MVQAAKHGDISSSQRGLQEETQANVAHPSIRPTINHLLSSRRRAHTAHDYLRSHFLSVVREQTLKLTNQVKLLSLCLPAAPK